MTNVTVYYDYDVEGVLYPKLYILSFGNSGLDWTKTLYIPISTPFEKTEIDSISYDIMSFTVTMGELIMNQDKPQHLGIYLPAVKIQAELSGMDINEIEQFVMLVGDIEEVMQVKLYI